MSYEYEATEAERVAAALLREKGWNVNEPTCPLCRGFGSIGEARTWGVPGVHSLSTYSWSTKPCPNGCPVPVMILTTQTDGFTNDPAVRVP